jgi:hypothetical protein
MDSDRVLVMADGRMMVMKSKYFLGTKVNLKLHVFKEFGHPYELLQIDGGYFRKMVDETGFQSAKILEKMAREVNISIASININYDV